MKIVRIATVVAILFWPGVVWGLEAGAAKERIVVPAGAPLNGLAERAGRPASGEHDSLWSRCLYLDDGQTVVFLVSVDLYDIPAVLRERVVAGAASLAPAESIILAATHTLSGPGGMAESLPGRWLSGRYHPAVLQTVADAIVASMTAARDQKRRGTLGYGTSKQRALLANRFAPTGPVDEQLGVIRVDDADGKAIAIAGIYGARPALAYREDLYQYSADYPGAYCREMELLSDPGCVALFLQGAGGDVEPVDPEGNGGWAQMDSVGRLLAVSAKGVANEMTFRDVKLKASYREVELPAGLSGMSSPPLVPLQTLEADGLLLAFVPGEAWSSIGLSLRGACLKSGYRAQFTVGQANGNLGSIVPRAAFAGVESAGHPFGPGMDTWLSAQVLAVAGQEAPVEEALAFPEAPRETSGGATVLTLGGSGLQRGFQRGAAFRSHVQSLYEERVVSAIRAGALRPAGEGWAHWPAFLDPSPLALPALGVAARPMLGGVEGDLLDEVDGFARGAGLAFDAAWLLQTTHAMYSAIDRDAPLLSSMCTMFGLVGERAGAEGALAGQNLGWPYAEAPVIAVVEPEEGHHFVQVGFDWQLGAFTGMNDAGVVLCVEHAATSGELDMTGPPSAVLVRQILQYASTFEEVMSRLQSATHLRGRKILAIARGAEGWRQAVVSYGRSVRVHTVEGGPILGVDIEEDEADPATLQRYESVQSQLSGDDVVGSSDVQALLSSGAGAPDDMGQIWNARTRHSVVLLPARLALQVAFPNRDGGPGGYTEIRLKKAARNE